MASLVLKERAMRTIFALITVSILALSITQPSAEADSGDCGACVNGVQSCCYPSPRGPQCHLQACSAANFCQPTGGCCDLEPDTAATQACFAAQLAPGTCAHLLCTQEDCSTQHVAACAPP